MEHYLDNAATSRVLKEAADEAFRYMVRDYYNPSSVHKEGTRVYEAIEEARRVIAHIMRVHDKEVFFSSGGTEAINTAISGVLKRARGEKTHVVTTGIEHSAVLSTLKSFENAGISVSYINPEADGNVDIDRFCAAVTENTCLVCMMAVNNETGVCLPIEKVKNAILSKGSRALFLCDMVAGMFKRDVDLYKFGIDLAAVSGHKFGAPKGSGVLFVRDGVKLPPLLLGGAQERSMRAGTENVPAIMGMKKAFELRHANTAFNTEHLAFLNKYLRESVLRAFPDAVFNTPEHSVVKHILNLSLRGTRSEVLMRALEGHGVFVSNSSACARGKRSHVLKAAGVKDELIDGAIRVSLSPENNIHDIDALVLGLKEGVELFFDT